MRPLLIGLAVLFSACGALMPPSTDGGGTGGATGGGTAGGSMGGGTGGGATGGGTGGGATGGGTGGGATGGGGGALAPLSWASMAINGATSTSYVVGLSGSSNDLWAAQDTGYLFHSTGGSFDLQFSITFGVVALYAAGGTVAIVQTRSIRTCTANCTTATAFADLPLLNSGMNWNLFGEAACGRGPNDITVVVSDTQSMGQLFHWDGLAWSRTNSNLGVAFPRACWFDSAGVLYVVGRDDVVRSDSGATTTEHLTTNSTGFYGGAAVAGTSWVVGPSSWVGRRNNATATWSPFSTSTATTLWVVGGLSANEVYALGYFNSAIGNGFMWNGTTLAPAGINLLPNTGSQSLIRSMVVTAPNELFLGGSNQSGPIIIRGRR